ncbi:MAG: tRNA (guanosine(46)-N7)-methyltransferase TrmB [Tenericutes bacterium]|nr:tRNA (guanosine(46)-N7)-methyltransferase TrmB [Mycoplasmatota bacterium]
MRLRKVKHAKDYIETNTLYVIPNPEQHFGKWSKVFNNSNPIEVEIGCGKGKFVYEKALNNPNINFIGIEKFDSVIVRALERLLEEPLPNVKLIRFDAEKIEKVFKKDEVSLIYLNFSDPWPKNRQAKRRLTSLKFLNRYCKVLSNNSLIKLKTDNFPLFQFSMMSFVQHKNYTIEEINLNLYKELPVDNVQTEFEKRFVEKGNLIFYQKIRFKEEK